MIRRNVGNRSQLYSNRRWGTVLYSTDSELSGQVVGTRSTRFNIQLFYVLPTECMYVFCVDLRTNSDYFPIQHELFGFYNWDGVCLLCGTDWIFIYNSTFCPQSVFLCFVWIWEQTAIISLYSINWLVFITETEFVYCAVRTESLYTIRLISAPK